MLDPIVGATTNEFATDLHLNDGQITATGERGAFRIDVINGHADIAQGELGADASHQSVIADQIDAIERNQKAIAPRLLRKTLYHPVNEFQILKRKQRQRRGDRSRIVGGGKLNRIRERPRNYKARQRMKVRIVGCRYEIGGCHHAPFRMTNANKRLGSARHQRLRIDF